jgi:serine/threonine protein kinase
MNESQIFANALKLATPGEQAAYLDAVCAGNEDLKAQVEALLKAHATDPGFLEEPVDRPKGRAQAPPLSGDATQSPPAPAAEHAGTVIGPYKLLQEIGEGGMGTVYLAEQTQPVRRTVALKLIKPGMDSRQVLARFGVERQALALMDHPNIAKVFNAGTTDAGRPYFVMELVKGIPITRFCDERRLTLRERLDLAIPVCQAVQHAHQKGIIHRDLKPSNVLIALYDGRPVPKVIDFGVAKATGPRLTDHTLYTEFGAVVGTLEYMSPEQAELNQLDIDTRSDIYSLGVLLYELLTGSTPLEHKQIKQAVFFEVLRLIREEESQRPSLRLSTTDELPSIAACRNVEPRKLGGLVRGELDWIVMKALEKDRSRRYETANGLARDLERYLAGDPVEAGPPSAAYRLRKFARKHRAALGTAAAFAVLLAVGSVVSTVLMLRALSAERLASQRLNDLGHANTATTKALAETRLAQVEARAEADNSKAVNAFLTEDLLTQAEPANTAAEDHVSLLEILDRAAAKVGDRFAGQPEVEDALRRTMAGTYHGLASWEKAEQQWRAVLAAARRRLGPESPEALTALGQLAHTLRHRGRLDAEVLEMAKSASEGLARVLGPDHPDTFATRTNLALAYRDAGRTAEAIKMIEANLGLEESKLGPDHPSTLNSRNNLAMAYVDAGRLSEAIPLFETTLKLREAKLGPDHPLTLGSRNNLARAYQDAGRTAEALKMIEPTLS